jgi:hypothetical protein
MNPIVKAIKGHPVASVVIAVALGYATRHIYGPAIHEATAKVQFSHPGQPE